MSLNPSGPKTNRRLRFPVFSRFSASLRRYPVRWLIGAGVLTAFACGGSGGGSGITGYGAARLVFTADVASAIRFAPDGRLFYTELATGRIRVVQGGSTLPTAFATLPVGTDGEQGLLGLALDPDFANNHYVYVFYTQASPLKQRIVRFTENNNLGTNMTTIVDDLPVSDHHNGGRIGFGPDGKLYVTIGDVKVPANSQDDNVAAGKLLRYEPNGTPANGNPISGNPMYAKGLRNPFGLAFHLTSGRPYLTENGPSCDDEIDRIVAGGNYGWRPNQPCNDIDAGYVQPIRRYTPCFAPTGATFYNGSDMPDFAGDFFFGSFNDGALRRLRIDDSNGNILEEETILTGRPGGVFDVTQSPDGGLYFCDGNGIYKVLRP